MIWAASCAVLFGTLGIYLILASFIPGLRFKEWSWGEHGGDLALGGVDSPLYRAWHKTTPGSPLSYACFGITFTLISFAFVVGLRKDLIPVEIGILAIVIAPIFVFIAALVDHSSPESKK